MKDTFKSHLTLLLLVISRVFHCLSSYYHQIIDFVLFCSVEVYGPKRYLSTTCDYVVSSNLSEDKLYQSVLDYVSDHLYKNDFTFHIGHCSATNLEPNSQRKLLSHTKVGDTKSESIIYNWAFRVPHNVHYKNEWIRIERFEMPEMSCEEFTYEKLKFTSYRRNQHLIYDLLNSAIRYGTDKRVSSDTTSIYHVDSISGDWTAFGKPKPKRSIESVILANELQHRIVDDVKNFLNSEKWYHDREIPYTRGYILYGPPGCGKSSLVRAIASEIKYDICLLTLATDDLTDYKLNQAINSTPEKSIILVEDIGAAFQSRQDECSDGAKQNLSFGGALGRCTTSFSGLLNALDGVGVSDARIVFLTTNYLDKLDPALIRPGRIDMKVCVDYPNDDQLKNIFCRWFKKSENCDKLELDHIAQQFVDKVRSVRNATVTMAMIQGLLLEYKDEKNPQNVINNVKSYFDDQLLVKNVSVYPDWSIYI